MENPWFALLDKLSLSRAESEAAKRYRQDPLGRTFLPVADILRNHNKVEESLQLLTQGLELHPQFTVARVILAREQLNRGMAAQALLTLENSPQSLDDNNLAQKLRFKLTILADMEHVTHGILLHMQKHQMLDDEIRALANILATAGFSKTKMKIIEDYKIRGIKVILPREGDFSMPVVDFFDKAEATLSQVYAHDEKLYRYHVVPLGEVFQGEKSKSRAAGSGSSIELDSTTLADIYAKQGHYPKAIAMYRRLLKMSPGNELLQNRLRDLVHEQRTNPAVVDPTTDPALVDKMESLEIIDTQTRFLNDLLNRINSR